MSNQKPNLLTVEATKGLTVEEATAFFSKHLNPGQLHFLKLLGFHRVIVEKAEGMYYYSRDGRKILDFFGGFGSLSFGHNHPRILEVRKKFMSEKRHEIAMAFISQYAVGVAKNLASISPDGLDIVYICCSGSEAVEAALKLAEKAQGKKKSKIVYSENSFHGKTKGALSVTDSDFYQSSFQLLNNRIRIPFGNAEALENVLKTEPSIGVLILETIQGGAGIVVPPEEYFKKVRSLCDQHNVLWIADEVQCGLGRTGRFFAFEYENVVPDIITLAKSLGGGKCAMGAYIARSPIYLKAYGSPKNAMIHGPATFGAMGEACCTAIESLNILYDENLMENARKQGDYLVSRLEYLRKKHNKIIKEVRGRGLMVGIEFVDFSKTLPFGIKQMISVLDDKLKGSLCGFIGSLLLKDYDVLVAFTEYNRNVIRLEPPLIVTREQIDVLINSLDDLLKRGIVKIVKDYVKYFLSS